MGKIEFEIKPEKRMKYLTIVAIAAVVIFFAGLGIGVFLKYVVNG